MSREVLPPELERAAWAPAGRVRAAKTRRGEWKEIVRGIAALTELDAKHGPHPLFVHKKLNLLTLGLELLAKHPGVVAPSKLASLQLALAAASIASVPSRFPVNSPFGSACVSAWTLGHRTFALLSPSRKASWRAPLAAFEKAALALRNAPRTHGEARLKSASTVKALLVAGRSAPWFDEAIARQREGAP